MKKSTALVVCLAVLASTLACDAGAAAPTVTLISTQAAPTAAPTIIEITATPSAPTQALPTSTSGTPAAEPTIAPPTEQPTQAQPSFPTPTRIAPTARPTSAGVTRVKIYLVAVGDNGKSGPLIGCEDSVVAVDRDIAATPAPLQAALRELLSVKDEFYGQSGLRNALYASNLAIDTVTIDGSGLATINLSGTISLAGECDDPRFEAQIVYTAKQFSTVKDVAVFINGTPMKDLLGGKN